MSSDKSNIDLYTTQTPNGIKISITLEELGLPYNVHKIDISKNTQKEPFFLEINPNGRIPAMTDTFTDGKPIRLFESGSIMQYLVARYDTDYKISFPPGSREFYEMTNWLFFMNAGVGPMQGQANHFTRYAPEHIEYGVNRYQNETRRLYGVLDKHMSDSKQDYLFPALKAWEERMLARPAVEKGRHDKEAMERHAAQSRQWVQEGMKKDAEQQK
ncbi:thioredoxin-like protein [Cryomyces antarcticus]